jgi:hypothetical protein
MRSEKAPAACDVLGRRLLSLERKNSGNFRREGRKCQSLPPLSVPKVFSIANLMKSWDFAARADMTPQSRNCDTLCAVSGSLHVGPHPSSACVALRRL